MYSEEIKNNKIAINIENSKNIDFEGSFKRNFYLNSTQNISLKKLLAKSISDKREFKHKTEFSDTYFFEPEYYNLNKVSLYNNLSNGSQKLILQQLSHSLLSEAYCIEMMGMKYAAKMNLEAQNLEERMFFALMVSEEAMHFAHLREFIKDPVRNMDLSFINLIAEIVDSNEYGELAILLQVLLEGWGLYHYSNMSKYCTNDDLTSLFKMIIKDEARHHGCGLVLAHTYSDSINEKHIFIFIERILNMIRIGPVSLVNILFKAGVSQDKTAYYSILDQLGAEEDTLNKLFKVKSLIKPVVSNELIQNLEEKNLFKPISFEDSYKLIGL